MLHQATITSFAPRPTINIPERCEASVGANGGGEEQQLRCLDRHQNEASAPQTRTTTLQTSLLSTQQSPTNNDQTSDNANNHTNTNTADNNYCNKRKTGMQAILGLILILLVLGSEVALVLFSDGTPPYVLNQYMHILVFVIIDVVLVLAIAWDGAKTSRESRA